MKIISSKDLPFSNCLVESVTNLSRYWIYSHHIKSTTKRKLIIDLAQQLHLNGFTHVGKPGIH
jgi:hypothetical protein